MSAVFGIGDSLVLLEMQRQYSNPWPQTFACYCVGGENCCIKRAEREREAAIRADERRKVLEEVGKQP